MNLTSICTQLQQDPDSLTWTEKAGAAAMLTEGLGWKDKLPPKSAAVLGTSARSSGPSATAVGAVAVWENRVRRVSWADMTRCRLARACSDALGTHNANTGRNRADIFVVVDI